MFRPWREVLSDPLYWLIVALVVLQVALRFVGDGKHELLRMGLLVFGAATIVVDRVTRSAAKKDRK